MKTTAQFCIDPNALTPSTQRLGGGGEAYPNLKTNEKSLQAWQALRFGLFIHWGPVSLRGTEISWSRGTDTPSGPEDMGLFGNQVELEDYDSLYKEFNPALYNPYEWVDAAKQAGVKYLILTARHHDGFSLWDTKYSDYNITASPYRHDIVGPLADACKEAKIKFGIYYSICDWYHPDYPLRPIEGQYSYQEFRKLDAETEASMKRYNLFLRDQLRELIERYDPFLFWFDGDWEWPWTHEMGMDLYAYLRKLKPDILINNRVDRGRQGLQGMNADDRFAGDFGTPEQQIGHFDAINPWESCITIAEQWAWKPNDTLKSTNECIQTLVQTVGGDGNLLFNVGPMLDGRIEQRQIARLKEMGDWLQINGEAVYGTRGGPYLPNHLFVSTFRGNLIYLHFLESPRSSVSLQEIEGNALSRCYYLDSEEEIESNSDLDGIRLTFAEPPPTNPVTVVVLEFEREISQ
ncbi:alpha-L-fucosidase [Pelagicoccus mobilis]|uniref:alpha-L-fucosidase n=1 Tax=Pelagicoccus mobilis TaxID=415221 RepID=A0A934VLE3_9BACT|nr:alpha-L-fucosidase [Pelagicoccus mobilis]MBK1877656.1 alpha-L-fucosidase [Pelagicoccus mobilis]